MCPEPVTSSDRNEAPGGLPDDALPAGLLEALRSDASAAAVRWQQVARARRRVEHVRLDDAELLEGIATSLLADSGAG